MAKYILQLQCTMVNDEIRGFTVTSNFMILAIGSLIFQIRKNLPVMWKMNCSVLLMENHFAEGSGSDFALETFKVTSPLTFLKIHRQRLF